MKLIKRICVSLWRKIKLAFTNPSIEAVGGMNTGASLGRSTMWAMFGIAGVVSGQPILAFISFGMLAFDLFLAIHVFRYLSELHFSRSWLSDLQI